MHQGPVDGVVFTQALAELRGSVKCISGDCAGVRVDISGTGGNVWSVEVAEGVWSLQGVLPGQYKVIINSTYLQ